MSITAEKLSKTGARSRDFEALIREQLQIIDTKLQTSDRTWGRNVVEYDLPDSFPTFSGLDKPNAQRIVYSALIRDLQRRDFEVKIQLEQGPPAVSRLWIAWVTDLEPAEIDAMTKVIRDARISADEVAAFRARGSAPVRSVASMAPSDPAAPPRPVPIPTSGAIRSAPVAPTAAERELLR